jgi:hypothetical protein
LLPKEVGGADREKGEGRVDQPRLRLRRSENTSRRAEQTD